MLIRALCLLWVMDYCLQTSVVPTPYITIYLMKLDMIDATVHINFSTAILFFVSLESLNNFRPIDSPQCRGSGQRAQEKLRLHDHKQRSQ